MKFLEKLKNKKVLIGIVVLFLLIGIAITSVILLNKNDTKKEEIKATTIELSEKLDFEINSELQLLSLIGKVDNGEIISEDEIIDTSKLGENEIIIKYLNEKQEEKEYTFKITIVDTEKPIIEFIKELTTTVDTTIDLLKDVKVNDNSKEDIKATVEGEYNFNKENEYKLKYIAVDSSGNRTEEEFTLKVNKKASSNSSSNSNSSSSSSSSSSNNSSNSSSNNSNSNSNNSNDTKTVATGTVVKSNDIPDNINDWRRSVFYWYASSVEREDGVIVNVVWKIGADSGKVSAYAENARKYMPSPPAITSGLDVTAFYGHTQLYVCTN